MYDRVSQNPGRVLITPEDGSGAFYATLALADNPTVAGTPLNKANLLSDATASAYGLGVTATPNAVLAQARTLITTAQNAAEDAKNTAPAVIYGTYVGTGSTSRTITVLSEKPIEALILVYTPLNGRGVIPSVFIKDSNGVLFDTMPGIGDNASATCHGVSATFSANSVTLSGYSGVDDSAIVYKYVAICS